MNKKINNGIFYVVISLVAVLAIGLVAAKAYSSYSAPKYNAESGATIVVNEAASTGEVSVIPEEPSDLGSVVGPTLISPFFSVNNLSHWYYSAGAAKATTTIGSFKSPSATSTLVFASAQINTATGTALFLEIGKGATYDATTTSLGIATIVSGARDSIVASTTISAAENVIFAPNQYLVFKVGATAGGITSIFNSANAVSMKAEFIEL